MRRALILLLLFAALLGAAPVVAAAAGSPPSGGENVLRVGEDVVIDHEVERVVVVGGDVRLTPTAHVTGDVIVLFGDIHREDGAQVDGSDYAVSAGLIDWIPGPGWVAGLLILAALLVYRVAVWAAVCAIAATLPRTASFGRWARGWEPRAGVALAVGVVAVVFVLPVLGLLAATGVGLPIALIGLAALLAAAGAGLALFREGPAWPRRPGRLLYAAYLILPPALEIGLLLTAAGGLGAGIRAISRRGR
ncbi:MAG: hypothetical protein AB7O78_03720 [Thermoleophilia bacterium]